MHPYFKDMTDSYAQTVHENMLNEANDNLRIANSFLSDNMVNRALGKLEERNRLQYEYIRAGSLVTRAIERQHIALSNPVRREIIWDDHEARMFHPDTGEHVYTCDPRAWVGISDCILKVKNKSFVLVYVGQDEVETADWVSITYIDLDHIDRGELTMDVCGFNWPYSL